MNPIERSFVKTRSGTLHIAACGEGFPVLLLHQTPRSWDEYRDVLPLLGAAYRAIAMDTAGFGDSPPLDGTNTIERWAEVAFDLLDALGIGRAAVVGHHTGAAIALEMAAAQPSRVPALVLSACPFVDAARRANAHNGKPVIDEVAPSTDGSHLTALWQRRMPFYPPGDIDLLQRFMADALKAGPLAVEGHHVVGRYVMEARTPLVTSPTLVLAPTEDPHVYPVAPKVAAAIAGSRLLPIEGGMVPLPDQLPVAFSQAVTDFLSSLDLAQGVGTAFR
jgi:pimeloyl-ACP methyl ester carboxylesterase